MRKRWHSNENMIFLSQQLNTETEKFDFLQASHRRKWSFRRWARICSIGKSPAYYLNAENHILTLETIMPSRNSSDTYSAMLLWKSCESLQSKRSCFEIRLSLLRNGALLQVIVVPWLFSFICLALGRLVLRFRWYVRENSRWPSEIKGDGEAHSTVSSDMSSSRLEANGCSQWHEWVVVGVSAVQLQGLMFLQNQGGVMNKLCLFAGQKTGQKLWGMSKHFFRYIFESSKLLILLLNRLGQVGCRNKVSTISIELISRTVQV